MNHNSPHKTLLSMGRPVAYYPGMVKHLGSVNAVIFFAQIFYWQSRVDRDIGIYKSSDEIEEETGLSYREQATARSHLRKCGVLIETHRRLEHRIYYRIDTDRLDEILTGGAADTCNSRTTKAQFGERRKRNSGNDESAIREQTEAQFVVQEITTETTTEITSGNNPPVSPQGGSAPPDGDGEAKAAPKAKGKLTKTDLINDFGLPEDLAVEFLQVRKDKRATLTPRAMASLVREFEKAGLSIHDGIELCCRRSWAGFKASWDWQDAPAAQNLRTGRPTTAVGLSPHHGFDQRQYTEHLPDWATED